MNGFTKFLLRGNLVELAVAFIIGTAFAAVVSAFTALVIAIIGAIMKVQKIGAIMIGSVDIGPFVNSVITFVIMAAVIYFAIVTPYEKFKARKKVEEPEVAASSEELLTEIRDLLASR